MSKIEKTMNFISEFINGVNEEVNKEFEDVDKEANQGISDKAPTLRDIPKLTRVMVNGDDEESVRAAKKLYELCDVAHKFNREPMVATGKYDVLNPLSACLLQDNAEKRRFACLTLNNLSIPHDNKRVMALERISRKLFSSLCKVIQSGQEEAYLCIICLMNLSFHEPAEAPIGQFSPTENKGIRRRPKVPPLENPDSLLRIMQELTAHASRGTADFRWAFGLLASLAKCPDNALLIGLTAIPKVAIENLRASKVPSTEWKVNSLEDFSLFLILHLAETSTEGLESVREVIEPIMKNDTGIQGLKATMICAFLETPWSVYPNFGVIAAASISELMGNSYERRGKKNTYDNNVFRLKTSVKAYGDLALAAAMADDESEESKKTCANTKVVALPSTIALLFQIISEIANKWIEEEDFDGSSNFHLGELATKAIAAVLPALLHTEIQARESVHTETACSEFSQILIAFAKQPISIQARTKATEAVYKITEASGRSALPLLEASYDLFTISQS